MLLRGKFTFIMRPALVLCLLLNLRICLSIPISTENKPQPKISLQDDSVPIALLLVVPSVSQFRDDGESIPDGEDISFIEDQLVNLLLRNAEIPFQEDHGTLKEESLHFTEDLRALNPLLRSEEVAVSIVVEEPLLINEDAVNQPEVREDFEAKVLSEGPIPSTKDSTVNLLTREQDEVMLVSEKSPSTEDIAQNQDEGIFLEERKTLEERPLERSYQKPEQIIATYPEVPSAIPILLNCAPKVERGHLSDAAPSYRSHDHKAKVDVKKTDFKTSVIDFKNDLFDAKNSDVLDLNSPASIITTERRKRHAWLGTGVTHYKVSEDYPEIFKGNHHLVSADYPQPNMVRITTQEH